MVSVGGEGSKVASWIEKRKDRAGKYTVRWKFRGRFGRKTVPDRRTAIQLKSEIDRAHALGIDWRPSDRSRPIDPCLSELIADWLERGKRTKRTNTLRQWRSSAISFLEVLRTRKARGRLTPDLLTERNLSSFYDWHVEKRGVKPATARTRTIHVSMFWKWAANSQDWGDVVGRFVEP